MDAINLSTDVLDWAAQSVGETLESLARQIAARPANRERIMRGELTVAQVRKIAKRTKVPFGLLFLDKPPHIDRPQIPDLRQTATPDPLSRDFFDVLADVLGKQEWYARYLKLNDARPLPFVGKYAIQGKVLPTPAAVADDVRAIFGLTGEIRQSSPDAEAYFLNLSAKIEAGGVLVMKSGIVKSNTHRPLSETEFRGFALADPFAPIIFVNGKDMWVATVFTLIHELAHILLGVSGVSDVYGPTERAVERLCNRVAADVLVPAAEIAAQWLASHDVEVLARHFRVSRYVIAIRVRELGLVSEEAFKELFGTLRPKAKNEDGGGNGLYTIPVRNSKTLTKALVASAAGGDTLIRDAAKLLNVRPATVMALARTASTNEPPR